MKIVLLPGLDGSGQFFGDITDELSTLGDLLILKLPPKGPQDYVSLADRLAAEIPQGEPFILVGESFSGPIAIELASRGLAGLVGILLVATFPSSPMARASGILLRLIPLMQILPLPPKAVIKTLLFFQDCQSMLGPLRDYLVRQDRDILVERVRTVLSCNMSQELKVIKVPVLALVANQDRLIRNGTEAWTVFPNVEVVGIDGPHFLLQDGDRGQIGQALTKLRQWTPEMEAG
jgi:pimeloyl-[acyl-carrier protein] methyl ester esterase